MSRTVINCVLLLLVTLLSAWSTSPVKAGEPQKSPVRVARPRQQASPARPRVLNPQELSQRGQLGRFKDRDLSKLGLVWRSGRDPRTCDEAWALAKVSKEAVPFMASILSQADRQPRTGAMLMIRYESTIADTLEASNRFDEADRFIRARLAVHPSDEGSRNAAYRRRELWIKVAQLYAPTRPVEAERILNNLVAEAKTSAAKTFATFRNQPKEGKAWAYGKAWYDYEVLAEQYSVLRPYYEQVGRYEEAAQLTQAMIDFVAAKSELLTSFGYGWSRLNGGEAMAASQKSLRTKIALRNSHGPAAEALLRECCGNSAEFARLLLTAGKSDEARVVLSRQMLEIGEEFDRLFPCMSAPGIGSTDAAIASARTAGEKVARGPHNVQTGSKLILQLIDATKAFDQATELGDQLNDAGLFDDARAVLAPTASLSGITLGLGHPVTLRALAALARQERLRGAPESAIRVWTTWMDNGGEFLRDQLWRVSDDDRRRFFRDDRRNVDQYLSALREARPADAGARALALSLRHKGLLASVAGEINARVRGRGDARSAATLAQLAQLRAQFAGLALHNRAGAPEALLVRRQMSDVEAQLAASLGAARPGESTMAAPAQSVAAALRPGEALVDFLVFADPDASKGTARERMVAIVVKAGAAPTLVWWSDVAPVRAAAARFRAAVLAQEGRTGRASEIGTSGRALYDVLWKPLLASLGQSTQILLGPDDVLNVVPLSAMPDEAGRSLIERYQISMLSAPRDLLARPQSGRTTAALVLGNPAFGAPPAGAGTRGEGRVLGLRVDQIAFSPLPGTLEEGRQVNAMLPGSKLLEGTTATKAAVLAVRSPSILHLATHGFFLSGLAGSAQEGDPLVSLSRSGLAFANANLGIGAAPSNGDTQGILTALEATSLDLRDTKLVVLSACETGLGETASGEGVYGLAQALHEAGAHYVLATLWPVSDKATTLFMQRFYTRIAAGDEPQIALRTVQRGFASEAEWRDPIYWAPFVITGR